MQILPALFLLAEQNGSISIREEYTSGKRMKNRNFRREHTLEATQVLILLVKGFESSLPEEKNTVRPAYVSIGVE